MSLSCFERNDVIRNNKKLSDKKKVSSVSTSDDNLSSEDAMRDQGYCRPRILVLCPFRGTALTVVNKMTEVLGKNAKVINLEKFLEEFGYEEEDSDRDIDDASGDGGGSVTDGQSIGTRGGRNDRPKDWKEIFQQNVDDDFKFGMQFHPEKTKGVQVNLFTDFYKSDVIVASPVGLKLAIESNAHKSSSSHDFLSSLEVVCVLQADVLYHQNWDHVTAILSLCNQLPQADHETDFSRVRRYFLDGQSAVHRQLIFTSMFNTPLMQAVYRLHSYSRAGNLRLKFDYPPQGVLDKIFNGVQQIFQKLPPLPSPSDPVDGNSAVDIEDHRFEYFKEHVLTPLLRLRQKKTLIVTPSYIHYVRIRNELLRREVLSIDMDIMKHLFL